MLQPKTWSRYKTIILVYICVDCSLLYPSCVALTVNQLHRVSAIWVDAHLRRPRGSQSGREKRRDESFQVRAKEPLGTDSHRAISKNSSGCQLLIGHKNYFVLLCPISEQFLLSSFREFVRDGYCFNHSWVWVVPTQIRNLENLEHWNVGNMDLRYLNTEECFLKKKKKKRKERIWVSDTYIQRCILVYRGITLS